MKNSSYAMFIPFCGLFGMLAGYILYGGGKYVFIGLGAGLILGSIMRIIRINKKNKIK